MAWDLFSFYLTGFLFFFARIVVGDDPQKKSELSAQRSTRRKGVWTWLRNHRMLGSSTMVGPL